jgi:hypothetical protein
VDKSLSISGFKFGVELESTLQNGSVEKYVRHKQGWKNHQEHCGSEVVSPILSGYAGMLELRRQIKALNKADAYTVGKDKLLSFENCGLHVHVDVQDFTLGDAKRLLLIASRFDPIIYMLMDPCRRTNKYCNHCDYDEERIAAITNLAELQQIQKNQRYSGVNFWAFPKHGTVEFRYAMGTFHWPTIYGLVAMYLRMVALAKSMKPIPEQVKGRARDKNKKNKEIFFDALELKGATRKVLDTLFANNSTATASRGPEKLKVVESLKV